MMSNLKLSPVPASGTRMCLLGDWWIGARAIADAYFLFCRKGDLLAIQPIALCCVRRTIVTL
jgi:hypothetical protein